MTTTTPNPVPLASRDLTKGCCMHVLIAGLYACTLYLSVLMYVIVMDGPLLAFLLLAPVLISAAILSILAIDYVVVGASWAWRRWRLARAN